MTDILLVSNAIDIKRIDMTNILVVLNEIDIKIKAHLNKKARLQELYAERTKNDNKGVDIREEITQLEMDLNSFSRLEISDEEAILNSYISSRVKELKDALNNPTAI